MAKILVVEDSGFQRMQILKALKALDHICDEAGNGEEGFLKATEGKYDLLMTDLLMPKLDGIGLIKKLNEVNYKTPIIVLSADIQKPIKEEVKNLGVQFFMNKPLDAEDLSDILKKILK